MKKLKNLTIIFALTLFYLALSSPAALAANIVIDKQPGPVEPGIFHTPNYANDAACIQAALDYSKSGDTVTIREGNYYITKGIFQKDKNLNIIGEGNVTFYIQTSEKEINEIYFGGSLVTSNTTDKLTAKPIQKEPLFSISGIRKYPNPQPKTPPKTAPTRNFKSPFTNQR